MPICANPVRFLEIVRPLPAWLGWDGGAADALTLAGSGSVPAGWSATRRPAREGES